VKTGNDGGLALRSAAEKKSNNIIRFLKNGTKVTVHGVEDGWAHVTVGKETGYVMDKFLYEEKQEEPEKPETPETPEEPEKPEAQPLPVIGEKTVKTGNDGGLALRSAAEKKAGNILGFYANGTKVFLHGTENGWAHVTVNGQTGYMMGKYLADKE